VRGSDAVITAVLARWHAPTGTLTWINCAHPAPCLVDRDGRLTELAARAHPALGEGGRRRSPRPAQHRLHPGERLVLVTDGITERRVKGGGRFGLDGLQRAIEDAEAPTAAATAMAIQHAVTECWKEPLEDDATVVVLAIE